MVSRVVDEIQPTLDRRVIELQSSIQAAVIQGDELRLEQVFQNLIQNALKYSPPAAPVWVDVNGCGSRVCVQVHDQGIGIPQEALPHLFERFYRAANVQEGRAGGIGIGLYVVKEIVELHGGYVTVQSTEGQGSTFTVYLPLA